MSRRLMLPALTALAAVMVLALVALPLRANDYTVDSAHTSVAFRIKHNGLSWVYGLFTRTSGEFHWDESALDASHFNFTIEADSIETGVDKRDDHLRSPDFFNTKQFPAITFKSTQIVASDQGWNVTGDLSLHGVTKTVTIPLEKVGEKDDLIGFASEFKLTRQDFEINGFEGMIGDEVHLMVSFEGGKKK